MKPAPFLAGDVRALLFSPRERWRGVAITRDIRGEGTRGHRTPRPRLWTPLGKAEKVFRTCVGAPRTLTCHTLLAETSPRRQSWHHHNARARPPTCARCFTPWTAQRAPRVVRVARRARGAGLAPRRDAPRAARRPAVRVDRRLRARRKTICSRTSFGRCSTPGARRSRRTSTSSWWSPSPIRTRNRSKASSPLFARGRGLQVRHRRDGRRAHLRALQREPSARLLRGGGAARTKTSTPWCACTARTARRIRSGTCFRASRRRRTCARSP